MNVLAPMFPFLLISTSLPVNMHIFQWIYKVSPQTEAKQRCGEGAGEGGRGSGHVLHVPNGAEGRRPQIYCIKTFSFYLKCLKIGQI